MGILNRDVIVGVVVNVLEDIEYVFKQYYGDDYIIKTKKEDDILSLCTDSFILSFPIEANHFYVTFMVGQSTKNIATNIKLLMRVLTDNELSIMEDSYYDKDKGMLVFGIDAVDARQKGLLETTGKFKCPICERIFLNEHLTEKGVCKFCNMDAILWN